MPTPGNVYPERKKERTEKQWVARWQLLIKEIRESTAIIEDELQVDRTERVRRLEADPEAWFRYYFPSFAYAPPAPFHMASTQRVLARPEHCEVRLWSRELAKSTRTMMEVLYLTLVGHPVGKGTTRLLPAPTGAETTATETPNRLPSANDYLRSENDHLPSTNDYVLKKRYVLLVSNSLDNATRLLMPYKANLEFNQRIIQDYGIQENAGAWQMGEFTTTQGVAFRAIGAGQSPRGTRNEEVRPDIILFDDVDTDADCLNKEIVSKRWRWIEEAAIGTRSISRPTTIIFCGNRIAPDCSIQRATHIADHVQEVNIRDENGLSSWPQKNTEELINRVLQQKSYAAQQKEYFNNPLTEGSVFKQMAYKPARPLEEYTLLICYTDPSYKDTGDYKATVLVGKWQHEYHVIRCFLDLATTAEMIQWHYSIMDFIGSKNSCYYFMEEVFIQDVIRKEVYEAGRKAGRTISVMGDRRKKPDKYARIESLLEPLHRNGDLYFNEDERHNPHMRRLEEQFIAFAPGSRAHDDGPDAVEGAIFIIREKIKLKDNTGFVSFAKPENNKRY